FTADIRASTTVDMHVHPTTGSHCVAAQDAGCIRLSDGLLHALNGLYELAANIDVRCLRVDGVRTNGNAFDKLMRRPAHDLTVLERARFGLVAVAAEVVRLAVVLHERPLDTR